MEIHQCFIREEQSGGDAAVYHDARNMATGDVVNNEITDWVKTSQYVLHTALAPPAIV